MERYVLPIAPQIDRHLNAIEYWKQVAIFPPGVAKWMFSCYGTPEVVPRVRIMVQLEQEFEASDRGLTVGHLKLLMDARRHPDHEEERCDKAAAHQSMVRSRLI